MAKKKVDEPQQIWDDVWYVVAQGKPPHTLECCDCGLVHTRVYKVENGQAFEKLNVNDKETVAARKRRGITRVVQALKRKEREIEAANA
jgi:hypothetical protein